MAVRLGSLFFIVLGTKSKVFVLFCLFLSDNAPFVRWLGQWGNNLHTFAS